MVCNTSLKILVVYTNLILRQNQNSIRVLLMAEQTQLLFLKGKLQKIRRDKRNYQILTFVIGTAIIIAVWGLQNWETNFITELSTLIILITGVPVWQTVNRHYNAEEAQLIWQIKQLTVHPATTSDLMKSHLWQRLEYRPERKGLCRFY